MEGGTFLKDWWGGEARVNLRMHWKINELVDLIQNHPSRVFCMKEASDQAQFT